MPMNVTKHEGDPIIFQDNVSLLCGDPHTQIYMHVGEEILQSKQMDKMGIDEHLEKGLEVNGSEMFAPMQIKCYILADDLEVLSLLSSLIFRIDTSFRTNNCRPATWSVYTIKTWISTYQWKNDRSTSIFNSRNV
jgi:hypothetical protein